ncbi:MAG TPA: outer-membrane lipoprotein carrier protein LolA [Burkholderiaceae bacterium]|nr:outer-membrane lipoprotein carrier protein LolA [Burkholderiaceae bacterium]
MSAESHLPARLARRMMVCAAAAVPAIAATARLAASATSARIVAAVLPTMAAAPLHAQKAAPPDLGTLLATIARQTVPRAKFYERKHIALLDTPVDSTGDLLFVAPSRLEKHTRSPQAESMVIDGDTLTLSRGGTQRTMSLQQVPEAAPLVDSLRATLAGDRQTLERTFRVTLSGTAERWSMRLVPLQARAQRIVREVRLSGEGGWVNLVEIDQADGDRSVMRVQPQP